MRMMIEVRHYLTADGRDLVIDWLRGLRDLRAKTAIIRRLNRLEQGNFGDFKPLRDGVCGGDKSRQAADIARAAACWFDWQRRNT